MQNKSLAQRRPHVLIVDDVPSNVQVLAEALKQDYEVYFATSGEQAIEMAISQRIDLMLLDIMMPEVDGFEVCRLMQMDEMLREIPVIFVTAKIEMEDEAKGFEVGGVDYITKPVRPMIVRARVRTHLELKASRDKLRAMTSLDGLTGLPNQTWFDGILAREIERLRLECKPLSLMLIGVDYFEQFNRTQGHLAGDRALCRIGTALLEQSGQSMNVVARYEGDQFALLCPDTDAEQANAVARDLLMCVIELGIPRASGSVAHLTASIGGVTLEAEPGIGRFATQKMAKDEARSQLLKAKQNGHNQFWIERISVGA